MGNVYRGTPPPEYRRRWRCSDELSDGLPVGRRRPARPVDHCSSACPSICSRHREKFCPGAATPGCASSSQKSPTFPSTRKGSGRSPVGSREGRKARVSTADERWRFSESVYHAIVMRALGAVCVLGNEPPQSTSTERMSRCGDSCRAPYVRSSPTDSRKTPQRFSRYSRAASRECVRAQSLRTTGRDLAEGHCQAVAVAGSAARFRSTEWSQSHIA